MSDLRGECWIWPAAITSENYGCFSLDGRSFSSHRAIYIAVFGPIPDDLELDHLCENKSCCNPFHLEAVTHAENLKRHWIKNPKNFCIKGHEFTPENTITRKCGKRRCRICSREYDRETKRRLRANGSAKLA